MKAVRLFKRHQLGSNAELLPVSIEALEGRRLLSASLTPGAAATAAAPAATVAPAVQTFGVTLSLQAGQPFNGYLGLVSGAHVNSATNRITASINWGDNSALGSGVITIGPTGHIDVGGAHTYTEAGNFSITITVFAAPQTIPGQPAPTFMTMLGVIHSHAIVAGVSTRGVEIAESAGVPFTAPLGTVQLSAPAATLSATINWGDGKTTAGTLKLLGTGRYQVQGSHTYAKAGEIPIQVLVFQKVGTTLKQVASIASKAVVTSVITGSYSLLLPIADGGAIYEFNGKGITGNLPLTLTGSVTLPGFVASGKATGKLTLKTSEGSVTFNVSGPTEKGFGPFPSSLHFTISGGTGGFAGSTGTGTIAVSLDTTRKTFALTLEDVSPVTL